VTNPAASLPLVTVNGEAVGGDATISVRDRGFTLADGVFETMRVQNGVVFQLERHLRRLRGALDVLGIPARPDVRQWVRDAVAQAGGGTASVRLTVTRGPGPGGLAPPRQVTPTVVVAVNPMPAFASATYERGLTARFAAGRRNEHSPTAGLKTIAFTDSVFEYLEAQRAGVDEAVFLDTAGHCSEATASNLFIWTGAELLTPPVSCAALPGITRRLVQEMASALGIASAERPFEPQALLTAPEAFLTSSLRGLAPLVSVQDDQLGSGTPGPITRRLRDEYAARITQECGAA
jgi:branched-chain amino acid aminotransferase